jgi:hypothetical protein
MLQLPNLQPGLNKASPKNSLLTMWIMWAALLLGQLAFMGIETLILSQGQLLATEPLPMLIIVNLVMLLTIVPAVFFVRRVVHRRARRPDGTMAAGSYGTGNLIFWAGCDGVSFFGLMIVLINRSFWPSILIVAVAMLCQVLTCPKSAALIARPSTFEVK